MLFSTRGNVGHRLTSLQEWGENGGGGRVKEPAAGARRSWDLGAGAFCLSVELDGKTHNMARMFQDASPKNKSPRPLR